MSTPTWVSLSYLVAAVCFILALKGLSSPKTARNGNLLGAFGATLAVVTALVSEDLDHLALILVAIVVGSLAAVPVARQVPMTAMPQLVALFNGVGGGAAAIVAGMEVPKTGGGFALVASLFTVIVGSVSFSGSMVTFLKLQEIMTTRPVVLPVHGVLFGASMAAAVAGAVAVFVDSGEGTTALGVLIGVAVASLLVGVLFVLPVGGADVPIVISLLNAFTGMTVAASGYVLSNVLLLVAGTLVGASGTILTRLMAKAMGRPITSTLFGALKGGSTAGSTAVAGDRPVRSTGPDDVAILLAEANVPYEQLKEMDEVNPQFATTDVVLVIGANDVVNPAARTEGTPISGMPILDVDQSQNVIFLKRSMRPGFAGIDNELLYQPNTTLLFGDAKDSLTKVVSAVKGL